MAGDKAPPNMPVRRAKLGFWDRHHEGPCFDCGVAAVVNILDVCQACSLRARLPTVAVHAEPWALKEVRRQHGLDGETSPFDAYRKQEKAEAMDEAVARARGAMTREQWQATQNDA